MTEEIIIDGVDVAGCEFYYEGECCQTNYKNEIFTKRCKCSDKLCYYKQLKRLEQAKNKYYQQTLDDEIQINNLLEEIEQIKQDRNVENITRLSLENTRLEQENKELKEQIEAQKGLITVGGKQQYEMTMAYDKCKSALEEIREIVNQSCNNCKYNKDDITCSIGDCGEGKLKIIENKINEVLGEN